MGREESVGLLNQVLTPVVPGTYVYRVSQIKTLAAPWLARCCFDIGLRIAFVVLLVVVINLMHSGACWRK